MNHKIKLFTYGTLRCGAEASHLMQKAGLIRKKIVLKEYALYNAGTYPYIKYTGNIEDVVIGDIYGADENILKILDDYEGDKYEKAVLKSVGCLAYVWKGEPDETKKIESGDWLEFRKLFF